MVGQFPKPEVGGLIALLEGKGLAPFDGEVSFNDPPAAEKPFAPHYEQYIRPHVREFEQQRIEALHKLRGNLMIGLPIAGALIAAIISMWMVTHLSQDAKAHITAFGFMAMLGGAYWVYLPAVKYASAVKAKIFPAIFSFFGKDFIYSEDNLLPISSLQYSGIIPSYNGEKTEDYIKGSYKEVSLELTEAKLTETTGTGKHRRTVTKFRGLFVLLSMNKRFSGKTIIRRDTGAIANWLSDKFSNLETVKLEDPIFEKQFECYSSDQVEARYLLTTSFMQRLLELSQLFGTGNIQCSFYENRLLLMLSSKENRFEVSSIFKPATFVDDINTILQQMHVLFRIIDVLKLDQKIGL